MEDIKVTIVDGFQDAVEKGSEPVVVGTATEPPEFFNSVKHKCEQCKGNVWVSVDTPPTYRKMCIKCAIGMGADHMMIREEQLEELAQKLNVTKEEITEIFHKLLKQYQERKDDN